ncbi:MAG: PAS domain-containing protein [Flavobacteriales bacterium]|nr:PAS domain-containing protein [Flavobacteriales bacterium]
MNRFKQLEQDFFKSNSYSEALSFLETCDAEFAIVSIHDKQALYVRVSPSVVAFCGYTEKELVGNSAYDYFHQDDFQDVLKSHARVTVLRDVEMVDYRFINSSGVPIDVTTFSKRISLENGLENILAFTFKRT